jgi:cell division protein FtsL
MAAVGHARRPLLTPRAVGEPRISRRTTEERLARQAAADPGLRRRPVPVARARQRSNRVGIALGAIVVAFLLAFFWLAQTMRVSAIGYEIDQLQSEQSQMTSRRADLQSNLQRLGREPAIRKQAIDLGLGQLVEPLVLDAR